MKLFGRKRFYYFAIELENTIPRERVRLDQFILLKMVDLFLVEPKLQLQPNFLIR